MKPSRQSGAALLILLLALVLGGLLGFLQGYPAQAGAEIRQRQLATERALAQAREALLGYAAAYPDYHLKGSPPRAAFVPGHLPCPDTGSSLGYEGSEAGSCGTKAVSVVGHFPWRTLGTPPLRDGHGHCLWYAVSGHYKASPKNDLLNPDIPGQFQIIAADGLQVLAGEQVATRPVAVIFAPGPALPDQQRTNQGGECGLDYRPEHFLDALDGIDNAAPNPQPGELTRLVAAPSATASPNDQLAWITPQDIFARRQARRPGQESALFDPAFPDRATPALAQRIAACLARFGNSNPWQRLPWAASLSLTGAAPDTFRNDKLADQSHRLQGRPPFSVGRSQQVLQGALGSLPGCPGSNASHSACRLLRTDNCPELLPVAGYPTPHDSATSVNSTDGWWDKWKDHLFYLVAPGFAPSAQPAPDCTEAPQQCLLVNGRAYAAALIYAGPPLAGQQRSHEQDRQRVSNYLEGQNAQTLETGGRVLAQAGNDQIVCLRAPTPEAPHFSLDTDCGTP